MKKKLTRLDLQEMKDNGERVVWITAYDCITAQLAEEAGMDMLLVGDSLGMVVYGHAGTVPVSMDQSICHTQAVRRGAPNTFVIGDMPFGSYHTGRSEACKNAIRFYKEADVDCIKLEGGTRVAPIIKAICDGGMLVMGHVGLTPQSAGAMGGFRAQGRTADNAKLIVDDAIAVYEAGAFSLVVEGVPPEVTRLICEALPIPVYGIGAGDCDGQVMVCSDILGLSQTFTPKFVKRYGNLAREYRNVFTAYIDDVRKGVFPGEEHVYHMIVGEADKLPKK
ncbi:MAG: 3-methyl-2-oxobutanoate hydroxymethyltransferase [Desulfobacteraceae bacterium]|nr:3-methyl-2-oxobutanoate hydroxymethyltransferase [Desulfobacteraceae bacterium]